MSINTDKYKVVSVTISAYAWSGDTAKVQYNGGETITLSSNITEKTIFSENGLEELIIEAANKNKCRYYITAMTFEYYDANSGEKYCSHKSIDFVKNVDLTHTTVCTDGCKETLGTISCNGNEKTCITPSTCSCSRVLEEAIGHDYGDLVEEKNATCTIDGVKSYYYCQECDSYFNENKEEVSYNDLIIEAYHMDTVITLGMQATCTKEGLKDGIYCNTCKTNVQEQEVIPALGHNIVVDKAISATCTEPGLTEGSHCSRCEDMTVKQEVVAATGHSMSAMWEYEDEYYHAKDCGVCGYVEKELHDDGTEANSGVRICETCNREYGTLGMVEKLITTSVKYTFSNYSATGTSVTDFKLDDNLSVSFTNSKIDTQLRVYSGNEVKLTSSKKINKIVAYAGYKSATLEVYGSEDGNTWVKVTSTTVTSTYKDVTLSWTTGYKYLKLKAVSNQVRIQNMTVDYVDMGTEVCSHNYSLIKADLVGHVLVCSNCNDSTKKVKHSGGTTGTTEAVCDICKQFYGVN